MSDNKEVFVVLSQYYEDVECEGAFSSNEKAIEEASRMTKKYPSYYFWVEKVILDHNIDITTCV